MVTAVHVFVASATIWIVGAVSTLAFLAAVAAISFAARRGETAGAAIAFSVQHGDNNAPWDIYVVSPDGRWISRKKTSLNEFDPVWSPDGRRIAFAGVDCCGNVVGGTYAFSGWILTMRPDGTHRRRLARGGGPAWSPDGRKIAFSRLRLYGNPPLLGIDVYVMNADGTGETRVLRDATDPYWAPDGTSIAFTGGQMDVYVVNADGSGKRRLTHIWDNNVAAWAPGRMIAFTHDATRAGRAAGVYVIDPGATKERTVARTSHVFYPGSIGGWSADGEWLLYSTGRGVSTWRLSDGSTRRLRDTSGANTPTWGPGGREIAFTRAAGATAADGLWVIDRDGSHARRVAAATGLDWYSAPAWTAYAR